MMRICAISDIHGDLPELPRAEVVCISGDFSPLKIQTSYPYMMIWCRTEFIPWMLNLDCERVIFIAGNHDFCCENPNWFDDFYDNVKEANGGEDTEKIVYLENESYLYKGKRFFGCPYSSIPGWAFSTKTGDKNGYRAIEPDVDVLLVHQAPKLNNLGTSNIGSASERDFGSKSLLKVIQDRKPKLVLCGHIHTGSHKLNIDEHGIQYYNVSIKNESYRIAYDPLIINIYEEGLYI